MSLPITLRIKHRADFLRLIRKFFQDKNILEVDTPLLAPAAITDVHIDPIKTPASGFLQTSPEYAMKRLLVAGSGDIFQLCKAFRQEEIGKKHREEFTLLEWYRLGFDQWQLMEEVADLVELLLGIANFEYVSYRQAFLDHIGIDPFTISDVDLAKEARQHVDIQMRFASRDDWLDLLMSHLIEPYLGEKSPTFIYDYPTSQAALAIVNKDAQGQVVAERFELYYKGLELCNGYHELSDASELRKRFNQDNLTRLKLGKKVLPVDKQFLSAMEQGLPACSGVAVGVDRLLMLSLAVDDIAATELIRG
ncbi:MAG: EF-P lysine aminoacylase GenX [Sinobacterium sp.]|nr:EF-P lysine aminoacylase GenX [Sinobacterium sp.]